VEEARRAGFSEHAGVLRSVPVAVAVPVDADDVSALLRWARDHRLAVVPRGAGTGMPGGNIGPGIVVDLVTHFRRVGAVDPERRTVDVRPGAPLAEVNAAASRHGLHFPVDPSSGARATLGGMIANNSAGSHSVKYGAVRPWVQSLDVVLADGTAATAARGEEPREPKLRRILDRVRGELRPHRARIEARWPRVRKNSSGYALREFLESGDAVDLLVGSEGTLALLTGATLRLAPLPAARGLALLEFTSLERAGEAVQEVLRHDPATCEMLDRTFLDLVRSGGDPGYPLRPELEAVLLVEVERGSAAEVEEALAGLTSAVEGLADRVVAASDPAEQERLWHLRHAASPLIAARAGGRVSMQFIEDGVVPVERLPDYVRALRATLERHALPAVIFGHAGDGNLHVNPLVDVAAAGWQRQVEGIVYEIADAVAALGGTMAGEHGDGRLRAPVLETVWGTEMVGLFRRVKEAFDPAGILNPGVILPLPGQRPLDAIGVYPAPA
ncbi:MAG TPA: FAD-binding oxidoreductase, partial [Longimicrobiaceae bacterium]|nr:FAD-binding oxidoreductase [Longimicrobiaceae bacterium]